MHSHHTTPQSKTCTKCRQELPATREFYPPSKTGRHGLDSRCLACGREHARRRREENPELERERVRQWQNANREKVRAAHRDYSKRNLQKCLVHTHRRRARKLNAPGTHTAADVQSLYAAQEGRCAYCGVEVGQNYDVDHIVPLSRGGGNGPDNLAIACPSCNRSKGSKLLEEWNRE